VSALSRNVPDLLTNMLVPYAKDLWQKGRTSEAVALLARVLLTSQQKPLRREKSAPQKANEPHSAYLSEGRSRSGGAGNHVKLRGERASGPPIQTTEGSPSFARRGQPFHRA